MRYAKIGAVAFALFSPFAFAQPVKVSSFGFDAEDSTRFVQAAMDSEHQEIVFDKMPSPWIVTPVKGRGNKRIVLEEGVEIAAKRGSFTNTGVRLLSFTCCTNIAIVGRGAKIRMWKEDYSKPPYVKSEYRHALNFESCSDVTVEGVEIAESGGDGIYLGGKFAPCRNVVLRNVVCSGNNRQGLSVISVDGLLVENCVFRDTRGTAPAAGIDFEPNNRRQCAKNVKIRDCAFVGNEGNGIEFALGWFDGGSDPVDIVLENCRSEDNGNAAFKVYCGNNDKTRRDQVLGRIVSRGCVYGSRKGLAVVLAKNADNSVSMAFEDCLWRESAMGVYRVLRDADWQSRELRVTYVGEAGSVQKVEADFAAAEVVDSSPGEMTRFRTVATRYSACYAFYAERARTVRLALKVRAINAKRPAPKKPMILFDADGAEIAKVPVPGADETEVAFAVPKAGFYRLSVAMGSRGVAELSGADVPIAFDVSSGGISMLRPGCRFYIDVPEKDAPAAVRVSGGGMREHVAVKLSDPDGRVFWEKAAVSQPHVVALENPRKSGVWSLTVSRSREGMWDDGAAEVLGLPGFLFPIQNRRWTFSGSAWRKVEKTKAGCK